MTQKLLLDRCPLGKHEVPVGTFCGGEQIPPGTFHGGEKVPTGTFHADKEVIPPGTFHGGEKIPPGTFHGGEQIPPGTFHATIYYRTKDGQADYGFSIERQSDGSYRPYITTPPNYRGRDDGPHPTHRLSDGGRQYVCWTHRLTSDAEARQVAARWADATQDYIRSGRRF